MELKRNLTEFLAKLPAVDQPAERKALIMSTGLTYLDIYLDWQGSNFAFFTRLLEELGKRGRDTVGNFLTTLPNAPQMGVGNRDRALEFAAQIKELEDAAWASEFGAAGAAPSVAHNAPSADMLATTLVSTILTPYLLQKSDSRAEKAGPKLKQLAEQVLGRVEEALAGDPSASTMLAIFKQQPQSGQAFVLPILKSRLEADPALTQELSEMLTTAESADAGSDFQAIVDVAQQIGTVDGSVVGAVIGPDALNNIHATVNQTIDTVQAGGTVVGAVVGGSGPVNIGGQHVHGDQVENINTGGGAVIEGDVSVGGDFVGRDKVGGDVTYGDKVGGDKISVGNIQGKGIAIGRNASANVNEGGLSAAEVATAFAPLVAAIQSAPAQQQAPATETMQALQQEAAKGEGADDEVIGGLIQDMVDLVPGAVSAVGAVFGGPLLSGLAGPATRFVLRRSGVT